MATNPATIVEWITGLVTSAQSGVEVGNSSNGFNGYVNVVNLAGTLAGTTPLGVGLNVAATGTNTVSAINSWMHGELTPTDVMQVTGSLMGAVLAIAAVSGLPVTATAMAIAAGVSVVAGPGAKDWFNDQATGLADAIYNALHSTGPGIEGDPFTGMPWPGAENPAFVGPFQDAKQVVCPLILDLDGNGVQVTSLGNGVHFDHDGTGFAVASAWVAGNDGLLAWDKNGDGQITTGNELFGDRTLLTDGSKADNGFEVLRG